MALNGNGAGRAGRLKSWKEIAAFFGADERTVKRWEEKRGLPVHRLPGGAKSTVYADTAELEEWLRGKPPPATASPAGRRVGLAAGAAVLLALAGGGGLMLRGGAPDAAPTHHQPTQEVADLYFAGRYNFEHRSPESLNRAVQLFSEAISRDPAYAEAYAGLANCHLLLREYSSVPAAESYRRARIAAQQALALDDGLADAHAALAFVSFFSDHDFAAGLRGFERAIRLDPSDARAHHWYASALLHADRVPQALVEINRAQQLEPQSHAILADKGLILFLAGRQEEAIALLSQMEAAEPDFLSPHAYLAGIHLARGDYPAFLAEERTAARVAGDTDRASIVAAAERGYEAGGAPAMYAAMIDRQRELYAAGREHAYSLAGTYALAGDGPAAMQTLQRAVRDRDPYLVSLRIDFRFAGLHQDEVFQRLALNVGGG